MNSGNCGEDDMSRNISTTSLIGARIARVSTVPFFVFTQLRQQIETLVKLGVDVSVVCSDGPELAQLKKINHLTCVEINIRRSISPWHDLLALVQLFIFKRGKLKLHIPPHLKQGC